MSSDKDLFDTFARTFVTIPKDKPSLLVETFIQELANTSTNFEANTWKLIGIILKSATDTPLTQYALLKQWIATISLDQDTLMEIETDEALEDDVEEEVRSMVENMNRAPFQKRQRLTYEPHLSEPTCRQQYLKIRSNDLRPMEESYEHSVANYIVNHYIHTNVALLEDQPLPCCAKERNAWRECVCQTITRETLGRYGRLLYYTLSGNTTQFLKECKTWEDVIWVYFNSRVEEYIDKTLLSPPLTTTLAPTAPLPFYIPDQIASHALSIDRQLKKNDTRKFFHRLQTSILNNRVVTLLDDLYKGFTYQQWDPTLYISEDPLEREQILRFIATLIVFGQNYLGWKETHSSRGLLSAFIALNSRAESFRPLVITTYCSLLTEKHSQVDLFSSFLKNLDSDDVEEYKVFAIVAKKYNLDIHSILLKTFEDMTAKAMIKCEKPNNSGVVKIDFTTKANPNEEELLKALNWLTISDDTSNEALQKAIGLIRYFLSFGKIRVVNEIIQHLNINHNTSADNKYIEEIKSHRELVEVLAMVGEWNKLMETKPIIDDNESESYKLDLYKWKDKVLTMEKPLTTRLKYILDGAWLDEDSLDYEPVSNEYLRKVYLPDLIIQLHKVLYTNREILNNNSNSSNSCSIQFESSLMTSYITCEREILLKDVMNANRMEEVLEEFSKSLY